MVWLNEAQHYFGDAQVGEQIAAALHALLTDENRTPVLVLGTLWPEYDRQYTALPTAGQRDPHSRVRELLAGRTVSVPESFDAEALAAAALLAQDGDQLLADALTRASTHGRVTQDLAGAPELLRRYENGSPAAQALLQAAMDARRLGVGLHLPQAFLIDAATGYLTDTDYDHLTDDWAEIAFAELAKRVHGKQAPLRRVRVRPPKTPLPIAPPTPTSGPVFRLADYLEQHGRETRRLTCPPASFWHAAHTNLSNPDEVDKLANAAYFRHRLQWAHHLKRHAVDVGHPNAYGILTTWLEECGKRQEAESMLWEIADAGDSRAFASLAFLRENDGDLEGAESIAQRAAEAGNFNLLNLLATWREQDGDRKRAESLMRKIADAGSPQALRVLAGWRREAGDQEEAEALARQAADAGDPRALTVLARQREEAGDQEGAEALARQAADAGDSRALTVLARQREEAGDQEGAEALARQAADAGDPRALTVLARQREEAGDQEG
ncbi:tetratricopeptide repeat protein, partial [Streptomyces cacaoi]|uniref:tetratricopeptide repeat protein n=1 Tax=Streptomyces cacaoi TaxID=1898 RepID=UPI003701B25C